MEYKKGDTIKLLPSALNKEKIEVWCKGEKTKKSPPFNDVIVFSSYKKGKLNYYDKSGAVMSLTNVTLGDIEHTAVVPKKTDDKTTKILGYNLSPVKKQAFFEYMKSGNAALVAENLNLTRVQIWNWKKQDWWKRLEHEWADDYHQEAFTAISKDLPEAARALKRVLDENVDPKMASAIVKAAETMLKVGRGGIQPMINSKAEYTTEINNVTNNLTINAEVYFPLMSPQERIEFASTGEIPDRLKETKDVTDEVYEVPQIH